MSDSVDDHSRDRCHTPAHPEIWQTPAWHTAADSGCWCAAFGSSRSVPYGEAYDIISNPSGIFYLSRAYLWLYENTALLLLLLPKYPVHRDRFEASPLQTADGTRRCRYIHAFWVVNGRKGSRFFRSSILLCILLYYY